MVTCRWYFYLKTSSMCSTISLYLILITTNTLQNKQAGTARVNSNNMVFLNLFRDQLLISLETRIYRIQNVYCVVLQFQMPKCCLCHAFLTSLLKSDVLWQLMRWLSIYLFIFYNHNKTRCELWQETAIPSKIDNSHIVFQCYEKFNKFLLTLFIILTCILY